MIRQLSGKGFWLLSADAGGRLFGFLANIYLARILGSESFGIWIIALAVIAYSMWIADAGLATVGMREMARSSGQRSFAFSDILKWKFSLASGVLIIGQGIIFLLPLPETEAWVMRFALLFVLSEAVLIEWYFKGRQRYQYLAVYRWLSGILYLLFLFVFVKNGADILRIPLVYAGTFGAVALLLHFFVDKIDRTQTIPHRLQNLLRAGFLIGAGGILGQIVNVFPPILLGLLAGNQAAGIYGAAARLLALALAADRLFIALFLPAAAAWWEQGRESFQEKLAGIGSFLLPAGVCLSLGLSIWAEPLVLLVFGDEYQQAAVVLAALSPFVFLTLLNSLLTLSLIASGHEKTYFRAMIGSSVFSLLFVIGSAFSANTAFVAAGVIAAEIAMIIFNWRALAAIIHLQIYRPLVVSFIAGIVIFLFAGFLAPAQWWRLPLDLLVFALLFLALTGFRFNFSGKSLSS